MARVVAFVVLATLGLVGCDRGGDSAGAAADKGRVEAAEAKAQRAAGELLRTLVQRLSGALAEGGPTHAVEVCAAQAQTLTAQIAQRHGVGLRRTALRVRNPVNRPDAFERAVLEAWAREPDRMQPRGEVVQEATGRSYRWMRPIVLAPQCVVCHGAPEQIPSAVRRVLAERYPQDEATGFAPGQLRGAVSVRVPLPD